VISFDQMGPLSLKPIQGAGWAPRKRPARLRATYAGSDVLWFMRTIRLCYPARRRIHWIQDDLSADWTPDIAGSPP
jgi:hypothetical protein